MDLSLFKEMAAKAQGKSLIDACLVEIESLRQQLVSVAKERDEIAAQARMLDRMVGERDEQLAAALAENAKVYADLGELSEKYVAALAACDAKDAEVKEMRSGNPEYVYYACKRILAIKPDASTLRQHDEVLIERCIQKADAHYADDFVLNALRELKETL